MGLSSRVPRARWSSAIKKKNTGEQETVVLKKCFKCKKRDVTIVGIIASVFSLQFRKNNTIQSKLTCDSKNVVYLAH